MAMVSEKDRKINAAKILLAAPPPYDADPIFAKVPHDSRLNYQQTLTVQWSNVPVPDLGSITVRAHVHYRWVPADGGSWNKFAGNAWISKVDGWQTKTTNAIVSIAPGQPTDADYHI